MKAVTKTNRDGSEKILLGAAILKEKPSRKRAKHHDLPFSIENLRMREIEDVIRHRHGNGIPDPIGTDDVELCHAYLRAVALTPASQDVKSWALVWAPWADPITLDMMNKAAANREKMLPADAVARLLYVTMAERTELRLKTIGACDISATERKKAAQDRKRERDRNRQEANRRAKGRVNRASYEATSLSQLRPWLAEGISRRTWERRRDASASQIDITSTSDTLASTLHVAIQEQQSRVHQACAAGLNSGLGDDPPAELQEAAPHGKLDTSAERAA